MTPNAIAVTTAFGAHARGQVITDKAAIEAILASTDRGKVHGVFLAPVAPASPAPATPETMEEAVAAGVQAAEAALHPHA